MINQNIRGHAWDIEDGWCHMHRQFCSFAPTEQPVDYAESPSAATMVFAETKLRASRSGAYDPSMWATVADLDYAVEQAGCAHNCGEYQAEGVDVRGRTLYMYRCACPGCGIITSGPR